MNSNDDRVECPQCKSRRTTDGDMYADGSCTTFMPKDMQFFTLRSTAVQTTESFHACFDCGLVWSRVSPRRLAELVQELGKESAKENLDQQTG